MFVVCLRRLASGVRRMAYKSETSRGLDQSQLRPRDVQLGEEENINCEITQPVVQGVATKQANISMDRWSQNIIQYANGRR